MLPRAHADPRTPARPVSSLWSVTSARPLGHMCATHCPCCGRGPSPSWVPGRAEADGDGRPPRCRLQPPRLPASTVPARGRPPHWPSLRHTRRLPLSQGAGSADRRGHAQPRPPLGTDRGSPEAHGSVTHVAHLPGAKAGTPAAAAAGAWGRGQFAQGAFWGDKIGAPSLSAPFAPNLCQRSERIWGQGQ